MFLNNKLVNKATWFLLPMFGNSQVDFTENKKYPYVVDLYNFINVYVSDINKPYYDQHIFIVYKVPNKCTTDYVQQCIKLAKNSNFVKEYMFNKSFLLKHKYDSNKDLKLNYKQAIILHKIYNYKTIKQNELFHIIEELDIVKTDSSFRYYLRFLTVNNLIEISKIENGVRNSVIFSEDKCSYLIDNNFINSVIDVESFFLSYNKKEFKIRMKYNQDEFTINKSELLILSILKNHSYTNIIDIYKEAVKFKRIGISSIRKLVKKLISYNLITVLKKSNHKIITLSYAVDKNSLPNQLHYS